MSDNNQIQRWGDAQQYISEPMPKEALLGPKVTLLNATPDPLGTIAAICGIYKGKVIRSLDEVTDQMRRSITEDLMKTVLNGPMEAADFVFLIEGVSRDFTHQAVRMRHSFFAQESLRFAVKGDPAAEIPLPPHLAGTKGDQPPGAERDELEYQRNLWDTAMRDAANTYLHLVNSGMAAEEARKVLPHATTTRYFWNVNLRGLLGEAGKRTCTQAQFDWRIVFAGIAQALRQYGGLVVEGTRRADSWQFDYIANLLRPVCYQQGKCGFMAEFDRGCSIRERVDLNEKAGRPSSEWDQSAVRDLGYEGVVEILPIHPYEWAADPGAARR